MAVGQERVEAVIRDMRNVVREVDRRAGYQMPGEISTDDVEDWADRLEEIVSSARKGIGPSPRI